MSSSSSVFARISKDMRLFITIFHGMLSLSMKWENPAECEAVSKAWQPSTRSACETKEVMKQASKDLMADVGQDDRGDEDEAEWQSLVRGCRTRRGSLVELAELINETYCIALPPVSILESVLIRNAALKFRLSSHLLGSRA